MTDVVTQADTRPQADKPPVHTRTVIIGTGFSGLGMAIALQKQGVDFVILEKADDVGGTWRDNTYPGCACDIPSHLYSYSFEPKPDWKNPFSYQPEIWDYLKAITEKYGLRRYIEFNSLVDRGYWDDDEYRWHVFTTDGREYVAQFLVSGAGALHVPSFPEIDGRDEFAGPAFHSAEWDHGVDLTGKRVAIIGTGASAIQIVPEIVGQVAELQLYQRTPPWVVPRSNPDLPLALRRAMENVPGLRALTRLGIYWAQEALAFGMTKRPNALKFIEAYCKYNIRRSVKDRELRRKLTPHYRIGCKRILNSSTYYGAVADPKTQLITDGISRITRDGIVTADGTRTPGGCDRVRHRLPRHRLLHLRPDQGAARRGSGRSLEPRGYRCPSRDHRRRYAQPVLPVGAEHRAGAQLGGVHDRIADPLRRRRDREVRQAGCAGAGADAGRAGPLQR